MVTRLCSLTTYKFICYTNQITWYLKLNLILIKGSGKTFKNEVFIFLLCDRVKNQMIKIVAKSIKN